MKIERQHTGTVDVLTPMGPLVDEDAADFCQVLLDGLAAPTPRIVVDMHEVAYLDSSALEGLLEATEELADRASSLKLAAVTPTVREVFELTDLSNRFRFFNEVKDAVKSFL